MWGTIIFLLLTCNQITSNTLKKLSLSIALLALPFVLSAQKIVLGTCTTQDGGTYKGQMMNGKPNGKGSTVFKNGNTYVGEYIKGKREG